MSPETTTDPLLECAGFKKLRASVDADKKRGDRWHDYSGKLEWVLARARHYAEKTGLPAEAILDAWEAKRDYWYMNYYQDCNQPEIKSDKVRVFDTVEALLASVGDAGYRCPACWGVSKSPYECTTGLPMMSVVQKKCDWKAGGLFGTLGKGVAVYVKEKLAGENIFMPVAWEKENKAEATQP